MNWLWVPGILLLVAWWMSGVFNARRRQVEASLALYKENEHVTRQARDDLRTDDAFAERVHERYND